MSVAVVVGVGVGLGHALVQAFADRGFKVAALARSPDAPHAALNLCCDITDRAQVDAAFDQVESQFGVPDVVIHNAGAFSVAPFLETEFAEFERAWAVSAAGAFHVAQRALPPMLELGRGSLLFGGATASTRGSSKFCALAGGKFALRALAQSLAREFGPQGIHVAHVLLDGVIWCDWTRAQFELDPNRTLDADAIAATYAMLHEQPRRAWTHELDLRPQGERF